MQKSVKFVPEECRGPDAKMSGHIMLKVPNFDEKFGLLESLGLELNDEGQVDASQAKGFAFIRKSVKASEPFFMEVALKNGEVEYKSFQDLSEDAEMHGVLMKAAMTVLSGMKLGND